MTNKNTGKRFLSVVKYPRTTEVKQEVKSKFRTRKAPQENIRPSNRGFRELPF